jgi:HNH endonuclease
MPGRRGEPKSRLPLELRLIRWLFRMAWRLLVALLALIGLLLWLLAWPLRRSGAGAADWQSADAFYRSHRWRRARTDALEANRERYGSLMCECCLTQATSQWHVDHIRPRSSHPELALEPANLQVLCADCNLGKGIRYATDWRCQGQS